MMTFAQILLIAAEEAESESGGFEILLPPRDELIAGIIALARCRSKTCGHTPW